MTSEKIQIRIYSINTDTFDKEQSFNVICKEIIDKYNLPQSNKYKQYQEEQLEHNSLLGFDLRIYFSQHNYSPRWKKFLSPILPPDSKIYKKQNTYQSYIAFAYNKKNLFAITGGYGYVAIESFTRPNFGLSILERLIRASSKSIRLIKERDLAGYLISSTRFFRGDQRVNDENGFGKIFKEVQAQIDKDIFKKEFGIEDEITKNVNCDAKSSFQLKKSVNLEQGLKILQQLDSILEKPPVVNFNNIRVLDNKRDEILKKNLNNGLMEVFYKNFQGHKTNVINDIYVCNSNFEDYLTADYYELTFNKKSLIHSEDCISDVEEVIRLLEQGNIKKSILDFESFQKKILALKILTFKEEDSIPKTSDFFWKHLYGEYVHNDKNVYFLLDGEWHLVEKSFIENIDEKCEELINRSYKQILTKRWKEEFQSENAYSMSYEDREGFYILDTISPMGIELADILIYSSRSEDSKEIILVHIKKGFSNKIRELTSQILNSAKMLQNDKASKKKYLVEIHQGWFKKKFSISDVADFKESERKFLEMFLNANVTYCLAFTDENKTEKDIKNDIKKFKSNIAKISLLTLKSDLRGLDFGLKICQIKK